MIFGLGEKAIKKTNSRRHLTWNQESWKVFFFFVAEKVWVFHEVCCLFVVFLKWNERVAGEGGRELLRYPANKIFSYSRLAAYILSLSFFLGILYREITIHTALEDANFTPSIIFSLFRSCWYYYSMCRTPYSRLFVFLEWQTLVLLLLFSWYCCFVFIYLIDFLSCMR